MLWMSSQTYINKKNTPMYDILTIIPKRSGEVVILGTNLHMYTNPFTIEQESNLEEFLLPYRLAPL